MEFANNVVTLIGNIFGCGLILAFLIGLIFAIRFILQVKRQDKEEYERKKKKDGLITRNLSSDIRSSLKTSDNLQGWRQSYCCRPSFHRRQ